MTIGLAMYEQVNQAASLLQLYFVFPEQLAVCELSRMACLSSAARGKSFHARAERTCWIVQPLLPKSSMCHQQPSNPRNIRKYTAPPRSGDCTSLNQ